MAEVGSASKIVHQDDLPVPPAPKLTAAVRGGSVELTWTFDDPEVVVEDIKFYQIFACVTDLSAEIQEEDEWELLVDLDAAPLPMTWTLPKIEESLTCRIGVRAVNLSMLAGPFSMPKKLSFRKKHNEEGQLGDKGQQGEATGGIVAAKPKFPLWSKVKVNRLLRQDAALSHNLYNGAFVYINYMYSYGRMTITARDDEDALLNFTQKLQKYAAKANRFRRIPDVNEIVIMPFEGNFHRGRVLSRKGEMVTLDLVDYGDTTSVKFTKLLEIDDNIRFEPIYGIIFELVDLPEDLPKISAVEDVTALEGQIEVEEMGLTEWKGKLWLNDDITWDEVILQAAGLM